jgi:hypothetical protein
MNTPPAMAQAGSIGHLVNNYPPPPPGEGWGEGRGVMTNNPLTTFKNPLILTFSLREKVKVLSVA